MRSKFFATCLLGLLFFEGGILPVQAKRVAPKPVRPVVVDSVRYSAPLDEMGFVVASDVTTGRELWRLRIYRVFINPTMEEDVQTVYIKLLVKQGHSLLIANERSEQFSLDLTNRKVRKLNRLRAPTK